MEKQKWMIFARVATHQSVPTACQITKEGNERLEIYFHKLKIFNGEI